MKKSLVAASAASLALAAMPALGAFAADQESITDVIQVTISDSCTIGSGTDSTHGTGKVFEKTVTNNSTTEFTAGKEGAGDIKVTCNNNTGWNIVAQGFTNDTPGTTTMISTGGKGGTAIPTGTAHTASDWSFRVVDDTTNPTGATLGASSWTNIPGATPLKVASKAGAVSEGVLHTEYQVYIDATQQADTYTGKVRYTVSAGLGS